MRINNIVNGILQSGFSTAKHYFQILGIAVNSSKQEIKSAYYRKVKEWHPDVTKSDSAAKFNEIRKAYEELSKISPSAQAKQEKKQDKQTKDKGFNGYSAYQAYQKYQSQGSHSKKGRSQPQFDDDEEQQFEDWQHGQQFTTQGREKNKKRKTAWQFTEKQMNQFEKAFTFFLRNGRHKQKYIKYKPYIEQFLQQSSFGYEEFVNNDEQEQYWDGDGQHEEDVYTDRNVKTKHRLRKFDIFHQIDIRQEELGDPVRIKFQRQINCPRCEQNSSENYTKQPCRECHKNNKNLDKHCPKCKGKGYILKYDCRTCKGKGTIRKVAEEVIVIPMGIEDGAKIIMEGRGNQQKRKGRFGDLIVQVNFSRSYEGNRQKSNTQKQKKAKTSQKQAYQINEVQINIFEAVLGCLTTIKLSKGLTQIKIPAGTQHGTMIKNKSYGKASKNVKVNLKVPQILSQQQREIFQKLRALNQKKGL